MAIFIQSTTNYNVLTFGFANLTMAWAKQLNTHLSIKKLCGNDGISGSSFKKQFWVGGHSAESYYAGYLLLYLYVREILNIYVYSVTSDLRIQEFWV